MLSKVTQPIRSSTGQDSKLPLSQSSSQAPRHPVPAPESFMKVPDMKIPRKERLFLPEGVKKNFPGGLGSQWDPEKG